MNNATRQSFRLRTMSYRHFRNAAAYYHRAIDGNDIAIKRAARNAFDTAHFYHAALAVPLDDK